MRLSSVPLANTRAIVGRLATGSYTATRCLIGQPKRVDCTGRTQIGQLRVLPTVRRKAFRFSALDDDHPLVTRPVS